MGKYPLAFVLAIVFSSIVLFDGVSAADCTSSDYITEYTECRTTTNTHSLVYYKDPASTCTGGLDLPAPKLGLPCNVSCAHGQYLAEGDTTCSTCGVGTVSHGGAIYVDSWNEWPTSFLSLTTFCKDSYDPTQILNSSICAGWQLEGDYISSGDTDDYETSVLEIKVIMDTAGHLEFKFLADGEKGWDGLFLFVDGAMVLPKNSTTNGVFILFHTLLSAGFHVISFEYFKDDSFSRGIDSALIQTLEIEGVYHSWDIKCDSCDEGQFAASGDGICSVCPSNTYSAPNAGSCTTCLSSEYSFPGSSSCLPKPICTTDDYQILGSKVCTIQNRQTFSGSWLEPHICTPGANLPAASSQTCPACDPGFYRDSSSLECVACPTGKAGGGLGSGSCQTCPAGTSASRVISHTTFNYWNAYESTGCDGICGAAGWRLRYDHIDSGQGHGAEVNSWYQLDITLDTDGYLYFQHYFDCTGLCKLSYVDSFPGSEESGVTFADQATLTDTAIPLKAGSHSLKFTFVKIGAAGSPTDLAKIFNITITNIAQGGAPSCVACAPGTTSSQGSPNCVSCPIGQSSNAAGTACVPCSGNTYTPVVGACIPCSPGTIATSDHSDCVSPCTYATGDTLSAYNVSYDFSYLTPFWWDSIGPFNDLDFSYYINFCARSTLGGICNDALGNSIITYVCQFNNRANWAIDLGHYAGYYPLPERYPKNTRGLEVRFTGGAAACAPFYGYPRPRNTSVSLVCDPLGGAGQLEGIVDQYGNDLTEGPKCNYNFEVRSIYSCPLCAQGSDWSHYYTACNNGKRTKNYYWLQVPPLCHDGAQPPALSEEVDCSHSEVTCPAGQFLDEPAGGVVCTNCIAGSYSLGGAEAVTNWPNADFFEPLPPLPAPYNSFCSGTGCTLWRGAGQYVISGNVDSSLVVTYDFVKPGYVSFNYKIFSATTGQLQLQIDTTKVDVNVPGVTLFNFTSFNSSIFPAGRHQIVWHFTGGNHGPPGSGGLDVAIISDVVIHGTDYHASQCTPCPAGTFADSGAATGCSPCPFNTFSIGSAEECEPCPTGTYTLGGLGASKCLPQPDCNLVDYMKIYLPCVNGSTESWYQLYYPSFCKDTYPLSTPESCGVCPPTLYWYDGECVVCGPEQHYNDITRLCENIPLGYVNVQHKYYFIPFYFPGDPSIGKRDGEPRLDPDFKTGCSGACLTNGWRATGIGADSGYHGVGAIDSWISVKDVWTTSGSLIFTYNILGEFSAFDGLQLFVDNNPIAIRIPYEENSLTAKVPIPPGEHTITWNFHRHSGSTGIAQIGPVELVGVDSGIAEAVACPAGTFNPNVGGLACLPCPAGQASNVTAATGCDYCPPNTFASTPGTPTCVSCPPGTSAAGNGSTVCQTSCVFTSGTSVFDLTSLAGTLGPVADEKGNAFWFSVCARGNNVSVCPGTHVCSKQGSNTISNGNALGFYLSKNTTGTAYFSLEFTDGDEGVSCLDGSKRSTVVDFTCDTQSADSLPRFVVTDANCTSYFTWATELGCPVCKDSDYTLELGGCDGSKQSVTKVRKGLCNGQDRLAQPSQDCAVPVTFPLAALLVPLFAFIALLAVAVVMFIRHRRISKQYSVLLASGGSGSRSSSIEMTSTPLFGAGSPPTSP